MAGLLDLFDNTPQGQQGLLGALLLGAAGPSREPQSFGQRLMSGLMGYQGIKNADEERKLKAMLTQAQIADIQQQAALRGEQAAKMKSMQDLLGGTLSALNDPGTPGAQNQYNTAGSGLNLGGTREPMTPQPGRPGGLAGMSPERIASIKVISTAAGSPIDLTENQKNAITGYQMQAGNYFAKPGGGAPQFLVSPDKGYGIGPQGESTLLPNFLKNQAALAAATKEAEGAASSQYALGPTERDANNNPVQSTLADFLARAKARAGVSSQSGDVPSSVVRSELQDPSVQFTERPGSSGVRNALYRTLQDNLVPAGGSNGPGIKVGLSPLEENKNAYEKEMLQKMGNAVEASSQKTEGAQAILRDLQPLQKALGSGQVIAGPTADLRIFGTQLGYMLGFNGPSTLENTRATIQGLAKLTLEGRAALKGQGQVSDFEQRVLSKANSADIDKMTMPELQVVVNTANRIANLQVAQHAEVMKRAASGDYQWFFSQQGTPAAAAGSPASSTNIKRYNMVTGRIE